MHGYYWDRVRLKEKLEEFTGGQFLMETKAGLVFRGEIRDVFIPDMNRKQLFVVFEWLCEPRFGGLDKNSHPMQSWILLEPLAESQHLDVEFRFYYLQRKREDREERIKMWTVLGEVCRFFKKGDLSNLVKQKSGEFLPSYQPSALNLGPED